MGGSPTSAAITDAPEPREKEVQSPEEKHSLSTMWPGHNWILCLVLGPSHSQPILGVYPGGEDWTWSREPSQEAREESAFVECEGLLISPETPRNKHLTL